MNFFFPGCLFTDILLYTYIHILRVLDTFSFLSFLPHAYNTDASKRTRRKVKPGHGIYMSPHP